jgi:ABC-type transport system involved in multi-copper enzyme maturation permease subunit
LLYVRGGWHTLALDIWPAVALVYVELMILVAVALLFSSFSSPALSALLTFFVFVIGHFSAELKTLSTTVGGAGARLVFAAVYYLLPNLSNYAYITAASHGEKPAASNFFGAVLYGLAYIAVLLAASTLVFKRRNFK